MPFLNQPGGPNKACLSRLWCQRRPLTAMARRAGLPACCDLRQVLVCNQVGDKLGGGPWPEEAEPQAMTTFTRV